MQVVSNTALISINETLIIQVVSFLIFLFIINRLMFRPLRKTMDDRNQYIENIAQEIADANADVEHYTKEIEKRKSIARTEALKITKELENQASIQVSKLVDDAIVEISNIRERAKEDIAAQVSEARKHIEKESETIALQIMEKALERRLST